MNVEALLAIVVPAASALVSLGVFIGTVRGNRETQARTEKAVDEKFTAVNTRLDAVDTRQAAMGKDLHTISTMVTAMAAQDPAVIQRLGAAEQEMVRLRDRQHTVETHVTTLHAKTDINARDVAEVRGAIFGTHPKPSLPTGGGSQP